MMSVCSRSNCRTDHNKDEERNFKSGKNDAGTDSPVYLVGKEDARRDVTAEIAVRTCVDSVAVLVATRWCEIMLEVVTSKPSKVTT